LQSREGCGWGNNCRLDGRHEDTNRKQGGSMSEHRILRIKKAVQEETTMVNFRSYEPTDND